MSTSPKTASGCQPCGYSISGLVAMTTITSHPSSVFTENSLGISGNPLAAEPAGKEREGDGGRQARAW